MQQLALNPVVVSVLIALISTGLAFLPKLIDTFFMLRPRKDAWLFVIYSIAVLMSIAMSCWLCVKSL